MAEPEKPELTPGHGAVFSTHWAPLTNWSAPVKGLPFRGLSYPDTTAWFLNLTTLVVRGGTRFLNPE